MGNLRKGFNFYKSYFEVGQELDDLDRLAFYDAILKRQFYGIEPNLKGISKLAYISQKHSIDAQIKGFEDKTGIKLQDPTKGAIQGGTQGGTEAPLIQEKEKEKGKEKGKEKEQEEYLTASPKFSFLGALLNYGFDRNLVEDWLKVRKTKKATNTETAFNKFIDEIEKRDCNINEILEVCVVKNWSGFQWSWYDNLKQQSNTYSNGQQIKTNQQIFAEAMDSEIGRNFKFK